MQPWRGHAAGACPEELGLSHHVPSLVDGGKCAIIVFKKKETDAVVNLVSVSDSAPDDMRSSFCRWLALRSFVRHHEEPYQTNGYFGWLE